MNVPANIKIGIGKTFRGLKRFHFELILLTFACMYVYYMFNLYFGICIYRNMLSLWYNGDFMKREN